VRMTRAFLPLLRATHGRLVNMGSIGARMPSAFGSSYLPAKAAMLSYSECVRQEVYRHGVKVAYIEPGFFETSLLTSASANGAAHASKASVGGESSSECDTGDTERVEAYPPFTEKMAKTTEQIRTFEVLNGGAQGVDSVVDATMDAICNKVPLTRYTVGYDALLMRFVLIWVPDRVMDLIQTYL
jgi:retinol dehydrogenase-16